MTLPSCLRVLEFRGPFKAILARYASNYLSATFRAVEHDANTPDVQSILSAFQSVTPQVQKYTRPDGTKLIYSCLGVAAV